MGPAELSEKLSCAIASPAPQFNPGKVPLRQTVSGLFRFTRPAFQLRTDRFLLRAIELIEFCEKIGQRRISGVMIDEIFQEIVAHFRRLQFQMRVSDAIKYRNHESMTDLARFLAQRFQVAQSTVRMVSRQFQAAIEITMLFAFGRGFVAVALKRSLRVLRIAFIEV